MFKPGDQVIGYTLDDKGDYVHVEGAFMFRTDDPEEYIQDVVIKTADGRVVYIDEQDARPASHLPQRLRAEAEHRERIAARLESEADDLRDEEDPAAVVEFEGDDFDPTLYDCGDRYERFTDDR